MRRILVSSCLLGRPVRYDGGSAGPVPPLLMRWREEGRVVEACPELLGGLPTPRAPAEIARGSGGALVLEGRAPIRDASGRDLTREFLLGARRLLDLARREGLRAALLKEGSPSCGSRRVYDGTFTGGQVPLPGVAAALLMRAGIRVFGEDRLEEAAAFLDGAEESRRSG